MLNKFKTLFLSDLGLLIVSMGIAGLLGYTLNIVVKREVSDSSFVEFATFWGAIYLGAGVLTGIQQEVTRAVSGQKLNDKTKPTFGATPLVTGIIGVVLLGLLLIFMFLIVVPPDFFGISNLISFTILFLGLAGYVVVAIYSGLLYGAQNAVKVVALMIICDASIRFLLVAFVSAIGYSTLMMEIAIGVPFVLVPLLITPLIKRFVATGTRLDVSPSKFLVNALMTMIAAGAMAFLITGFPLLLRVMLSAMPVANLAAVIFVITLSRAPLIVVAMSLQSFFISQVKNDPRFVSRILQISLFTILASCVLGVILALWGDFLFTYISGSEIQISFVTYFAIGISSGFIAVLFIIGALLLARNQHTKYLWMWLTTAISTSCVILLPTPDDIKLICTLVIPPLLGVAIVLIPRQGSKKYVEKVVS